MPAKMKNSAARRIASPASPPKDFELTTKDPVKTDSEANSDEALNELEFDRIIMIGSEEEVYRRKKHKYKEVKHYIKGEVLGRGKFGTVREFVDKHSLKRYAGKIIRRYILKKDPHLRRQINKELAITYHFDHRNIMRVYDLFTTTIKIYMFMEFCYGELSEFLSVYNCLPKCQAKDYFAQILEGLNYLHSRRIIHRDIKPDNILVSHNHTIKLADFGVCTEINYFALDDTVHGNDGTPLYQPPEVFDPEVMEYSGTKLDIWGAGVILYQMLTGILPFFNKPTATKDDIDDLLHKNVDYPKEIRRDVLLRELLNKIFEKNYKKRATILEIKRNPWMQIDYNLLKTDPHLPFPTKNIKVDCYRGMTVLTRIHDKYYPPPPEEYEKLVNYKVSEESRKARPLLRGSRLLKKNQQQKISLYMKPLQENLAE